MVSMLQEPDGEKYDIEKVITLGMFIMLFLVIVGITFGQTYPDAVIYCLTGGSTGGSAITANKHFKTRQKK